MGSDEVDKKSTRVIKKDFKALDQLVDGTGVQVLCSLPLVARMDDQRNKT